eukprot:12908140-Prorocentrum_lima.AAC.1
MDALGPRHASQMMHRCGGPLSCGCDKCNIIVASHHWQLYALGMSICRASPIALAHSAALAMGP